MKTSKNTQNFMQENQTIIDMAFLMAGGWFVSLQDIESIARITSLVVPTCLSVILFIKNQRRKNGKKEN